MPSTPYGGNYNSTSIIGPLAASQASLAAGSPGASGLYAGVGLAGQLMNTRSPLITDVNNLGAGKVGFNYGVTGNTPNLPQGYGAAPAQGATPSAAAAPQGALSATPPPTPAAAGISNTADLGYAGVAPQMTAAEATAPGAAGVGDAAALSSGAGVAADSGAGAGAAAATEGATGATDAAAAGGASVGGGLAAGASGAGGGMLAGALTSYLAGHPGSEKSQIGSAVGSVAGAALGSFIGMPFLGGLAGGAIGGLFADGGQAKAHNMGRPIPHLIPPLSSPGQIGQQPSMAGALSNVHGRVNGAGDGRSDSIQAMLSSGEYVIPADVVAALGQGSNDAGSDMLDQRVMQVRARQAQKLQGLPTPHGAKKLADGGTATPEAFGMSLMSSPYR